MAKLFLRFPFENAIRLIQISITDEEHKLFLNPGGIKNPTYLSDTGYNLVVKRLVAPE